MNTFQVNIIFFRINLERIFLHKYNGHVQKIEPRREKILRGFRPGHVEQSSFIQIVDMNRLFPGNPVSVWLIIIRLSEKVVKSRIYRKYRYAPKIRINIKSIK